LNAQSFKPTGVLKPTANIFTPTIAPASTAAAAQSVSTLGATGLDSLEINNEFTPSTPYVHKFRTEMCKNFELYGKCKYGDEVSIYLFFAFWRGLTCLI
jgi:hypothetical protein